MSLPPGQWRLVNQGTVLANAGGEVSITLPGRGPGNFMIGFRYGATGQQPMPVRALGGQIVMNVPSTGRRSSFYPTLRG